MTTLAYLNEPGVLWNLSVRYGLDDIYTYTGSILIAVNPFAALPHLYGPHMMEQYRGVALGELSPHVYAVADASYRAMRQTGTSQSILVSGESGAGKTETAKLIMQYLAWVGGYQESSEAGVPAENVAERPGIEQQVLESNPLLEAFGNARTVRNDNSSRFGKFTEIQFDASGRISGAAIRTFLLERSRVASINDPERNYHVFYQICDGLNAADRARRRLLPSREFAYLSSSTCHELPGQDNAVEFERTRRAMTLVGIPTETQEEIFDVVAAVLHLGNVSFAADSTGDGDGSRVADEASERALEAAAHMLQVSPDRLVHALTTRTRQTRDGPIVSPIDPAAAATNRDSLSRTLYARLFDWLVDTINARIGQDAGAKTLIGVLDIAGFESFAENDFEQFCINFANEKLQQHFNGHVFKAEQAEYEREKISWSYIDFADNQDVLDLIEGRVGLIDLLDETCRFPNATNADFATKIYGAPTISSSKRFAKPKLSSTDFTVHHYAGDVTYKTDNFLTKNRDFVVAEHQQLLGDSTLELLREIFKPDEAAAGGGLTSSYKFSSVAGRFKRQLTDLMAALRATEPHYVRCIKPNAANRPAQFENNNVLHQLRCGGVLEAVRISCAGFPTRLTYAAFADHFWPLAPEALQLDDAGLARAAVAKSLGEDAKGVEFGVSKVFLRAGRMAEMDSRRTDVLVAAATRIQAAARGWLARRRADRELRTIVLLQAYARGWAARRLARSMRRELAATRIQAAWRRSRDRAAYLATRDAATRIQAAWRGMRSRRATRELRECQAATRIQAAWRGSRERRRFLRLRRGVVAAQGAWRVRQARRELRRLRAEQREAGKLLKDKAALEDNLRELREVLEQVKAKRSEARRELREERAAREAAQAERAEAEARAEAAEARAAEAERAAAEARESLEGERAAEAEAAAERLREAEAAAAAQAAELRGQLESTQEALRKAEAKRAEAENSEQATRDDLMNRLNNALAQRNAAREEALAADARLQAALEEVAAHKRHAAEHPGASPATPHAAHEQSPAAPGAHAESVSTAVADAAAAISDRVRRYVSGSPARTPITGTPGVPGHIAASGDGLSEMERRQRELYARQAALLREQRQADQDRLLAALREPLGFSHGRPVAALVIFRSCLQWKAFAADRTPLFDRIVSTIGSMVDGGSEDYALLSYWLSNSVALLALLHRHIKPAGGTPGGAARLRASSASVTRGLLGSRASVLSGFFGSVRASSVGLGTPGGEASIHGGAAGGFRQVEAKYPALLFRQQLDALVQKIFPTLRDNIKREVMPHVSAAIHAPRSANARPAGRGGAAAASRARGGAGEGEGDADAKAHWTAMLNIMERTLQTLRAACVPAPLIAKLFEQLFSFINVQLFNQLLLRRECCSFSNGEYVKSGLSDVELWIGRVGRQWVGDAWEELAHIRQAVTFLVIHQKHRKSLREITSDLCPVLSVQQLYRISTMYWDDRYGTETVSTSVLTEMKQVMVESSATAASHSFLLDEDSATPFSQEDVARMLEDKDLLGEIVVPPQLKDQPGFAFLNKRLEVALQNA